MKKILFFLVLSFLLSCTKEKDSPRPHPNEYTSQVILTNLPPIMGGCIDESGNLKSFSIPIYGEYPYADILLSAKIHTINPQGTATTFYDFTNTHFYLGASSKDTMANIPGWLPRNIKVDLARANNNSFFMSYNGDSNIHLISAFGKKEVLAKPGILSIISSEQQGTLFITSPIYSGGNPNTLVAPVIIYAMDSFHQITEYFRFPDNLEYTAAGLAGSLGAMFPMDMVVDISVDKENNIYVCLGYDNVIYKLDKEKRLTAYRTDIFCPTSIAFDKNNIPFVVSAPKFIKTQEDRFILEKPLEILMLKDTSIKKIYEGTANNQSGGLLSKDGYSYIKMDANYNISINTRQEIFLEDSLEGKIVLVK